MALIPGGVTVGGFIAPTDSDDTYPTFKPIYGLGGYRSVADTTERDAITTIRREEGMMVYTQDDDKFWYLKDGITNDKWTELALGGTVAWDEITGDQSDINVGGFTNDAGYITQGDIDWATNVPLNETDPVFTAWLAVPPNVSTFTNDAGYLTSESDPLAWLKASDQTNLTGDKTGSFDLTTTGKGTFGTTGTDGLQVVEGSHLRIGGTTSYPTASKIKFGDGDYVTFSEDTDDHLTIHANFGMTFDTVNDTYPITFNSRALFDGLVDANLGMTIDGGNVTINDDSGDYDFRIEGDSESNLFCINAGNNSININESPTVSDAYSSLYIKKENSTGLKIGASTTADCITMGMTNTYKSSGFIGFNTDWSGTQYIARAVDTALIKLTLDGVNDPEIDFEVKGETTVGAAYTPIQVFSVGINGVAVNPSNTSKCDFIVEGVSYAATFLVDVSQENVGIYKYPTAGIRLDVDGSIQSTTTIKSSGATSGIGYATGAGGTVTQGTSKSTAVTMSPNPCVCGTITTHNAALASLARVTFTVTDSAVAATDNIILTHKSGGTTNAYATWIESVGAGSFTITLFNVSGGSLSEALVLNFAVIKSVTS